MFPSFKQEKTQVWNPKLDFPMGKMEISSEISDMTDSNIKNGDSFSFELLVLFSVSL